MKTFVTFGQEHIHRVNCQTIDCNTVAVIEAKNAQAGRAKAEELFGRKFCTTYYEPYWMAHEAEIMKYYPNGYTNI